MRFLLITVTDLSPESRANLELLLESLAKQRVDGDMVLVVRGEGAAPALTPPPFQLHPLRVPHKISLSAARNAALALARTRGLLDAADAVGFPDDDCAYPDGLLSRVATHLDILHQDIICGPYAPSGTLVDRLRFPERNQSLSPMAVMNMVSSNNVFLTAAAVRAIGDFDERLGLGARYGASEDSDYVLRGLDLGFRGSYLGGGDEVLVLHPYKPARPGQYYVGNVAVLAIHARSPGGLVRLLRRLAVGLARTAQRQISSRDYLEAVLSAGRLLSSRPR